MHHHAMCAMSVISEHSCLYTTPGKTGVMKNTDNSGSILHRQECQGFGIWVVLECE